MEHRQPAGAWRNAATAGEKNPQCNDSDVPAEAEVTDRAEVKEKALQAMTITESKYHRIGNERLVLEENDPEADQELRERGWSDQEINERRAEALARRNSNATNQ